jgi:hypothetical protein
LQNQIDADKNHEAHTAPATRSASVAGYPPLHSMPQLQQQAKNQALHELPRSGMICAKPSIS